MFQSAMRFASRFILSAGIAWSLIPIAAADAPEKSPAEPTKRLFTVPEDGMGDKTWLSGATRLVREITEKRPNEDLVICVAGCVVADRVVYAQPAEVPPKDEPVAAAEPADGKSEAAKAVVNVPAPMNATPDAKPEASDGATLKPSFVPTASGGAGGQN